MRAAACWLHSRAARRRVAVPPHRADDHWLGLGLGSGTPRAGRQAIGATTPFFTALLGLVILRERETWLVYSSLIPVVIGAAAPRHSPSLPACRWLCGEPFLCGEGCWLYPALCSLAVGLGGMPCDHPARPWLTRGAHREPEPEGRDRGVPRRRHRGGERRRAAFPPHRLPGMRGRDGGARVQVRAAVGAHEPQHGETGLHGGRRALPKPYKNTLSQLALVAAQCGS